MDHKTLRLLIVEDEVLISMHLARQLEEAGYALCKPVTNGPAAIAAASDERPDVVLLDIRLRGDMDGIEAGQAIRQQTGIPIVFLTGYSDPEIDARAREITSAEILGKPATVGQIRSAIEQLLG